MNKNFIYKNGKSFSVPTYSKQTHALSPKCLQGLSEKRKASEQTHQNVESRKQREV